MSLLRTIEICLNATNVPPSRFGRDSVHDPRLVHDLRRVRAHVAGLIAGLPDPQRRDAERRLRAGGFPCE